MIRFFVYIHKEQNYRYKLADIQRYYMYFCLFCLNSESKPGICMRKK